MRRIGHRVHHRRGFTFVETIIVSGIVGLCVALGISGLQRLRQNAATAQCTNNLRQIGLAYLNFVDKNGGDPRAFKGDAGWYGNLRPFLGSGEDTFFCPNLDRTTATKDVPTAWIRVRENNFSEFGSAHDIPISKSSPRMRLSTRYPQTATCYFLEMEDWTDWNWRDLDMRVEVMPEGGHRITAVASFASFTFDFLGPDRRVMVSNYKPAGQGNPTAILPSGRAYGVSTQAAYLGEGDNEKVLILEYGQPTINVFGNNAPDYWPAASTPRHSGSINVLFRSGVVRRFADADIDPRSTSVYERHWLPTAPGPF